MFLTALTRGRLFVPDTNPLRGPLSSFVDGGCPGNLPQGQRIGDAEVLMGRRFGVGCGCFFSGWGGGWKKKRQDTFSRVGFRWTTCAFKQTHFLCYILYIEQWEFRFFMSSDHHERYPQILDVLGRHMLCPGFGTLTISSTD